MIQFKKLRLTGFKSFVEHSELLINTGLTGVVGPNGCGKSNLVEALRWVMGESSAKQMRGGEMDDVIFAGSGKRPARNVAEVALLLDNAHRTAPALFNEDAELFVTRRIERAKGSNYKVNGRDVRARDVQLLFADAATGARSTAMVSQGRIGAIINAKPQARRMVLEEAAGISGLHTRRHEAELRLKGAETNLERLDDVLVTLDTQQTNLQKQARQASRYHSITERIKKAESLMFHMKWIHALDELDINRKAFKETDQKVMALTRAVAEATTLQSEAAEKIPALRETEARAAAALQRLSIENENLDREEKRLNDLKQDLSARLEQTRSDLIRESEFFKDAEAALERLLREQDDIHQSGNQDQTRIDDAQKQLSQSKSNVRATEDELSDLTREIAQQDALKNALKNRLNDLDRQVQKIKDRLNDLAEQQKRLNASRIDDAELQAARHRLELAQSKITGLENNLNELEIKRGQSQEKVQLALQEMRECQSVLAKLEAEEDALVELLDPKGDDLSQNPVMDQLSVKPGYEIALGAALGDDLSAAADETASVYWTSLAEFDPKASLPDAILSLDQVVGGSDLLARRLSQVGIIDDFAMGLELLAKLQPGQRLVSRDGAMIRWDGLIFKTQAPSKAALRLKQKNRLAEIRKDWEKARRQTDLAEQQLKDDQKFEQRIVEDEKNARLDLKSAQGTLSDAQKFLAQLEQQHASFLNKMENLSDLIRTATEEDQDRTEALAVTRKEWENFEDPDDQKQNLSHLRETLQQRRDQLLESQSAFDQIKREKENRQKRLDDIAREKQNWSARIERAGTQIEILENRQNDLTARLGETQQSPEEFNKKRTHLLQAIETAENERTASADRLAEGETALRDVEKATREAENELNRVREDRIRLEALMDQGKQLCVSLTERIRERLDCKPEELPGLAEITEGSELPDLDTGEKRLERLYRERDTMGPVNLRAETELEELKEQIETLSSERVDLVKAIDKLRQGINALNREGRERLLVSFNEVNLHFQSLFTRLFGGGQAHLELVEDEDPLNAGLEILASPPGKKLQSLSLLSGGEQALTALALLFGVFLTNPAPICVLDEVDAPLDDANVDRFCTLLEEMAREGETRFLIITHHRMTMARMDRLFGVTMTERGVSQLVSVDLQKAEELVES